MIERLQKYMAANGLASRRKSESLITSGEVKVNGVVIRELGYKIDTENDLVEVSGRAIGGGSTHSYFMLNKPREYVSTAKDQFGRASVTEIIKDCGRLYPVGRLDYNTTGLLILTNDGDLTYRLTHPKHEIPKTYEARLKGKINREAIKNFSCGIDIGNYITRPASLEILSANDEYSFVQITISEGKNRQIRKMCTALGHEVIALKRIAIGDLRLEGLSEGSYRRLNEDEIRYLKGL